MIATTFTEEFRAAIEAAGLTPPDDVIADGVLRRFSANGRRGDDAGWYVLHGDGIPAGSFGDWRGGFTHSWCAKADTDMTEAERQAHRTRVAAMRAVRDVEQAELHRMGADLAAQRWAAAKPAKSHTYLATKGVQPHGLRLEGDTLLVPLRDADGKLHSLQTIAPDGSKRFMTGARVAGCYLPIGKPKGVLVVCEGYATGASIHECTGHAVAVAFNAGNLLAVAKALHAKFPKLNIVVAADDDWRTDGNPGMAKAREAATAVGGVVAVPVFPGSRPDKATDFNDLHHLAGADAVRACIEAAQAADGGSDDWPEPFPLPDSLPPVMPFDAELLPEALRRWVADIAHRSQCPPDFVAVGALVALSSLIGARHVVAPKQRDDWRVVPNLWGLVVGRPGVMKSPALAQSMAPLDRLEAAEREQWKVAHATWEVDAKISAMVAEANDKQARALAVKDPDKARALLQPVAQEAEPRARRFVVNDATVEKLAELLTDNPWGLLVYRDEVHGLLTALDRQGQEGSRGFYLTGYDGNQGHAVDRMTRASHYVPRVCLALLGGIQPGKVQSYVREAVSGGTGDDGLLQRFGLAVWPDVKRSFVHVDQWPDTPAKQAAGEVFERLAQLQPANDTEPVEWRFSPEAQELYVEWSIPFETEIRGDELHPALVSHLAKYRKLVPALALLFALIDTPDAGGRIGERELMRALAWATYLRSHAERLYAAAVTPDTEGARLLLDRIRAGRLADGFKPWEVSVKHWAGLATPDAVRKAADLLTDHGWLRREVTTAGAAGGRPSERYLIHPSLLKGGAA